MTISYFDPVYNGKFFNDTVQGYFDLGCNNRYTHIKDNEVAAYKGHGPSMLATAAKIISYFIVIVPALMLLFHYLLKPALPYTIKVDPNTKTIPKVEKDPPKTISTVSSTQTTTEQDNPSKVVKKVEKKPLTNPLQNMFDQYDAQKNRKEDPMTTLKSLFGITLDQQNYPEYLTKEIKLDLGNNDIKSIATMEITTSWHPQEFWENLKKILSDHSVNGNFTVTFYNSKNTIMNTWNYDYVMTFESRIIGDFLPDSISYLLVKLQ